MQSKSYNKKVTVKCEKCGIEFQTFKGRYCNTCRPLVIAHSNSRRRIMMGNYDPSARMRGFLKLDTKCPKCSGRIEAGGTRFGWPAPELKRCINCGLTNDSSGYRDEIRNVWVEAV